jgi:DNA-binding IclR family transcriptional regulator
MTRLQNKAGATVLLGVNMEDQLVYVDKREGRGMIRVSSEVGWRRPLNYGMLGMVLMSSLDPRDVKRILKKYPLKPYTPLSITDTDAFSLRLEQIRDQGFVLEKGEAVESVIGIAAPVRDYSRQVVAALGIALPTGLGNQTDDLDYIIDLVKNACETISSDLGYLKI